MLAAAEAIDLRVWATLHDGSIPRWFDNDGGFGDDETFTEWWPRWVERAADRFGDRVAGWIPFAEVPATAPPQPWRDTWSILEGTSAVIASLPPEAQTIEDYVGRATLLGIALATPWASDDAIGDRQLEDASTQWGNAIRDGADAFGGPIAIAGFRAQLDDPEAAALVISQLVASIDDACTDGVDVEVCFVEPAIAGPDTQPGLLDADRNSTPIADTFLP